MQKTVKKRIKQFALIFIILCNVSTLFYVAPLKENLSYLGNELGHKALLITWGCSAAIYFYLYTSHLMKQQHYTWKLGKFLLVVCCIFMCASVLLPYDPIHFPQLSKWHIRIAMWGTSLYVGVFFHFLFDSQKRDIQFFQKNMPFYGMLVAFDLLLFMLYGSVSTLLEISFTIGMAILLYHMGNYDS